MSNEHGHNILKLFDVLHIFFSSQVKRSAIISNKHGIYELPHELSQNGNFVSTTEKLLKNRN